jgi:phage anti-repressor protein
MTQNIVPKAINFKELVKNSNTTLSLNVQTKMVKVMNEEFTESEQQWYIANLYVYMNYHPTNDFPINLANVFKMIGFANKGNAMKTIKSNFTKDEDYKVALFHTEKRKNEGGHNKEDIMLNIDTFKNLCMIAKTEKGKEIRKYYVKLENLYNKIIKEEIEENKLLLEQEKENTTKLIEEKEEKEKELIQTQLELKKEKSHKNQILRRKYYDAKPGNVVYLYKDNEHNEKSLLKIGKSKNISEREKTYSNLSKNGTLVYVKRCLNCDLTESLLHHLLDKYRVNSMQDESIRFDSYAWFELPSEEFGIKIIDTIVYLMDSQIESIDTFIPNLYTLLDLNNLDIKKEKTILEKPPQNTIQNTNQNTIQNTNINPLDFDKFIEECCELSSEYKYPKADIKQAHRVWSKCSTKDVVSELDNYLKINFSSGVIIENDIKRNVYKGLKLKPLTFTPQKDENPLDYEHFILEKCKVDWCYRISYVDFFTHFVNWKKRQDKNYNLTYQYKKQIQDYLEKIFAGGRVHLSSGAKATHLFGVWGLGMEFNNFGLKIPERTCKKVHQYNSDTNELIKTWDSLSIASRELGIAASTLSNYCRFNNVVNNVLNNVVNNYIYKYE